MTENREYRTEAAQLASVAVTRGLDPDGQHRLSMIAAHLEVDPDVFIIDALDRLDAHREVNT